MFSAWSQVDRAQKLLWQGQTGPAQELLEGACRQIADHPGPQIQLGLLHLGEGHVEGAIAALEQAVERDSSNPAPHLFLSVAYSDAKRGEEAEQQLQKLEQLCPGNQALPTLKAVFALRSAEFSSPAILEDFDLTGSRPLIGRLLVELERRLLPVEIPKLRHSRALSADEIAELETPEGPSVSEEFRQLPQALRASRLQKRGLRLLEKGFREPDPALKEERVQRAAGLLKLARKLAPLAFRSNFYLGEALLFWSTPRAGDPFHLGRVEAAHRRFIDSWKLDGINPYVLYYLGRSAQLAGKVEAAINYFDQAIEKFEKLPEAHYGKGQCQLLLGDAVAARSSMLKAADSDLAIVRERLKDLRRIAEQAPELLSKPLPELPPPPPEPEPEPEPEAEAESAEVADPQPSQAVPADETTDDTEPDRPSAEES